MIAEEIHTALTESELSSLIYACERCECDFNCFCASNAEWAERQLEKLKRRTLEQPLQEQRGPNG